MFKTLRDQGQWRKWQTNLYVLWMIAFALGKGMVVMLVNHLSTKYSISISETMSFEPVSIILIPVCFQVLLLDLRTP